MGIGSVRLPNTAPTESRSCSFGASTDDEMEMFEIAIAWINGIKSAQSVL